MFCIHGACLYNDFRFVSSKEIEVDAIPAARLLAIEAVCAIEDSFPRSILVGQLHLIVHLIDEIALCGVVHTRWMFFLERFLKTLKDFVRQRAQPEASMAEGWIVQDSFVYVSEYLATMDSSMPRLWNDEEDPRIHSHVPSGRGKTMNMDRSMRDAVNNFCILNADVMNKWVNMYQEAKAKREEERRTWKRSNGGRRAPPFPRALAKLPDLIDIEWVHYAMRKAREEGEHVTNEEWEYARGCLYKVICKISLYKSKLDLIVIFFIYYYE